MNWFLHAKTVKEWQLVLKDFSLFIPGKSCDWILCYLNKFKVFDIIGVVACWISWAGGTDIKFIHGTSQ
jgi:hypothetical protein